MAKKNFYAVKYGKEPGIYNSWEECKKQVEGVSMAIYKGFSTKKEAERFLSGTEIDILPEQSADVTIYIDGSYDGRFDIYGYGCVAVINNCIEQFSGAGNDRGTASLRNVAGEMLAAMKAVRWSMKKGYESVLLCYDYRGIEDWVTGAWEAKNPYTYSYSRTMRRWGEEIKIYFSKVKAHTGVRYNEMADQAAKKAVIDLACTMFSAD